MHVCDKRADIHTTDRCVIIVSSVRQGILNNVFGREGGGKCGGRRSKERPGYRFEEAPRGQGRESSQQECGPVSICFPILLALMGSAPPPILPTLNEPAPS